MGMYAGETETAVLGPSITQPWEPHSCAAWCHRPPHLPAQSLDSGVGVGVSSWAPGLRRSKWGACPGTISAAADCTGTQRMPDTHLAYLCTSMRHPQTPARTHIHPKAHSFAHVSQPVTGCTLPEGPAPTLCQPRHPDPTNLSLSGGELGAGQEQEAAPQEARRDTQLLGQPLATKGLQLTHPAGPFGTPEHPTRCRAEGVSRLLLKTPTPSPLPSPASPWRAPSYRDGLLRSVDPGARSLDAGKWGK